jgi:hypothetical protein
MTSNPLPRAGTKGQREGADLHQRLRRVSLLKLLAWPALCFALGFLAFAGYYLQLGGWVS